MNGMSAPKGPYAADTLEEIRLKETGLVSRFLDGVWNNIGKHAAIAIGITGAAGYINGGFEPWMVPVGLLAGLVPAAAEGLSRWIDDGDGAAMHDLPAVQRFIAKVEETARGPVAAKRGSVWILKELGADGVEVLTDGEYARYKKDVQTRGGTLDEVLVRRGSVSVSRTTAGRLDPGGRNLPAVEGLDLRTGLPSLAGWFLKGAKAEPAAVAAAVGIPPTTYRASRFLSGGTGFDDSPAKAPMPRYSASRFLRTGESGFNDPEEAAPAFGR